MLSSFSAAFFCLIQCCSVTKPFSDDKFRDIYSKATRLCVEVIIQTEKGIVLTLRQHSAWRDMWHIPGGTVYYGERLEETVKRVTKEEVGVEVCIKELLGYIHYPSEEKERGYGWSVGMAFLCEIKQGQLLEKNSDGEEIKEFSRVPERLIEEQEKFLVEKGLLRSGFDDKSLTV